jgi:hypothetical protein
MTYRIFVRNWWKHNEDWPNGLEPDPHAEKTYIARKDTEKEAQEFCREYNRLNEPGELSRKAEYEER